MRGNVSDSPPYPRRIGQFQKYWGKLFLETLIRVCVNFETGRNRKKCEEADIDSILYLSN